MIPAVIAETDPSFARAQRLAAAATSASQRVALDAGDGESLLPALGETLMWIVALEDLLKSASHAYVKQRDAPDGAVLPGIRYARNAIVHGELVVSPVHAHGGAMLGAAVLGTFALGEGPSIRWSSRAEVGFTPARPGSAGVKQQEQSYDREFAGGAVLPPLLTALAFVCTAAGV